MNEIYGQTKIQNDTKGSRYNGKSNIDNRLFSYTEVIDAYIIHRDVGMRYEEIVIIPILFR